MPALPRNLSDVQTRSANGEQFEFLFFWGHKLHKDGTVTKSCLSQWYPSPFKVNDLLYPTAEHWMMAEKARRFDDLEVCGQILMASTPKEAKKLGRKVRGFNADVWAAHCRGIVTRGNVEKFRQNPPLLAFLLGTAGKVLVEASHHDKVWGIGMLQDDPRAADPLEWKGENLLGFALMDVREELNA